MFAEYAGALAEARRACYALRPDDALRRKIEHELRKIEVAAERGLLCDERIEEALLGKPNKTKEWRRLAYSRAPARDAALRQAALAAWNAFASLFWPSSTSTMRKQRQRESPVYRCNEHMRRAWRRCVEREDALDLAAGVTPPLNSRILYSPARKRRVDEAVRLAAPLLSHAFLSHALLSHAPLFHTQLSCRCCGFRWAVFEQTEPVG